MSSKALKWEGRFIGKTINPEAIDRLNSKDAGITASKGIYRMSFSSLNSCEMHPATIRLRILTKNRVIKQIKALVHVVYFNPPVVKEVISPELPKGKDDKMLRDLLMYITRPEGKK